MDDDPDPFGSYGLSPIRLEDKEVFDLFFSACRIHLSDYTFANSFIWRDSIHLRWRIISDCLCVFANGDGGLTMLFPPLGPGDARAALRQCMDICETYNARAGLEHWTRVEYVSMESMDNFPGDFVSEPMSGDYVYETARLIDLAGGDLASKRQARNRFARRYTVRTENFAPGYIPQCLALLATWQEQSTIGKTRQLSVEFKRAKEIAATADAMHHAEAMGLKGMVLLADDRLVGFTLGEYLCGDTCSILIEKTDRRFAGSAQYIFSEFCRQYWADTKWCNVGDDWEIESLAWTKQSYRPAYRIPKWVVRPAYTVSNLAGGMGFQSEGLKKTASAVR
jgi:hypothetical protein